MTMDYVVAVISVLCLLQAVLLFRVLRVLTAVDRAEDRLAHFSGALALLTETTEEGFRTMALEIARAAKGGKPAAEPRVSTTRVVRAARQGRSFADIAADEQVSEGEVRLRLSLAESAPRARPRGRKNGEEYHGTLHA